MRLSAETAESLLRRLAPPPGAEIVVVDLLASLTDPETYTGRLLAILSSESHLVSTALSGMPRAHTIAVGDIAERATDVARELAHPVVTVEHLMLAAIRAPIGDIPIGAWLSIDFDRAADAVRLGRGEPPATNRPASTSRSALSLVDQAHLVEPPGSADSEWAPFEDTTLGDVVGVAQVRHDAAADFELLCVEIRDGGVSAMMRAHLSGVGLVRSVSARITDDLGTHYTVARQSWGGGDSEGFGLVLATPSPPHGARRLSMAVGSVTFVSGVHLGEVITAQGRWQFVIELAVPPMTRSLRGRRSPPAP